jgi:hypothetical protein
MQCSKDICSPGKFVESTKTCSCPDTYFNCDSLPEDSPFAASCANGDKCFLDPCSPGKWVKGVGCTNCPKNTQTIEDPNSIVGVVCGNICEDTLKNPCGIRGTCKQLPVSNIAEIKPAKAICDPCNSPYSNNKDPDKLCNQVLSKYGRPCTDNDQCISGNCRECTVWEIAYGGCLGLGKICG